MLLVDLIGQFLAARALDDVSPRTIEWYHYNLDPLAARLGQRPIEDLTAEDLAAFLASQKPGRSSRTLRGFHTALTALFNFALERGHLAISPMKPIRCPGQRRRHIPDYFTEAQIRALLDAADNRRDHAILLVLLDTGLRRDELLALDVEDIDCDEGFILVRGGKGDKDRYVPVGHRALAALREYLMDHPRTGALFRNRFNRRLKSGGLRSMLLRLKAAAGLDCRVHPHKFRHTFARYYLAQGGDLETLRDILGHEDIRLTSDVYACFLRSGLKEKHRRCSPVDTHEWQQPTLAWRSPE